MQSIRFLLLLIFVAPFLAFSQQSPDKKNAVQLKGPELNWFNEARYGMFIHWGIYSVPARGEWVMNRERIPKDEYIAKYANKFTAEKFNAGAWCELAKKAGMKYVVLTARHHDGFALWDTKTTDFNAMNYGPRRDLVKEYVDAARKAGLKIGFYYSVADWSHPDYPGAFARDWETQFKDDASWKRFVKYYQEQVTELMTRYGKIDILWWDGCIIGGNLPGENINEKVLKLQPGILINDRNGGPYHYKTSEQKITAAAGTEAWEACFTLNENWSYHATDDSYKSPKDVLAKLITCAGSGGNLLLNIGPKADGTIPKESVDILLKTGKWLKKNRGFLANSEKSGFERIFNNSLLTTSQGEKLFLHFLFRPTEDDFCYADISNKVKKVYFQDGGKSIEFVQQGDRLFLKNVKKDMRDGLINTVVIETEGKPKPVQQKNIASTFKELNMRGGLPNFFAGINKRDTTVVAYLGGSITSAPGYRVQSEQLFRKLYPNTHIKAVNAGLGGTGSDLGVFRLQNDVLRHKPNLVFLEFAVNDYGTDSVIIGNAMEGIIRQIKQNDPKTDICLLYTLSRPMVEELSRHEMGKSMRIMERLADHYQLPSINFSVEVINMLQKNELVFETKDSVDSQKRIIFSNDGVHPITAGHAIYTETIRRSFDQMKDMIPANVKALPTPLFAGNYAAAKYLSPEIFSKTSGWKKVSPTNEFSRFITALPNLIYTANSTDSLVIRFRGTLLGIEDIIGPTSSGIKATIDGRPYNLQRFDRFSARHRRSYYHFPKMADGLHTVVLKLDTTRVDKLNIAKKEEIKDSATFKDNFIYVGKIMMVGEPVLDR